MELKYKLVRDNGKESEVIANDEAIHPVVYELAKEVGVIPQGDDERACTLGIETMLKTYKDEHGASGLTDAVDGELKVLHKLHPDRVRMRWTCQAHQGISCDYAVARGDGKRGLKDLCTYQNGCELSREEAV